MSIKEIEFVSLKIFAQRKLQAQVILLVNSIKHLRKKLHQ